MMNEFSIIDSAANSSMYIIVIVLLFLNKWDFHFRLTLNLFWSAGNWTEFLPQNLLSDLAFHDIGPGEELSNTTGSQFDPTMTLILGVDY